MCPACQVCRTRHWTERQSAEMRGQGQALGQCSWLRGQRRHGSGQASVGEMPCGLDCGGFSGGTWETEFSKDASEEEVSQSREPPVVASPSHHPLELLWPNSFSRICHLGHSTHWAGLSPVVQIQRPSLARNSSQLAGLWTAWAALLAAASGESPGNSYCPSCFWGVNAGFRHSSLSHRAGCSER